MFAIGNDKLANLPEAGKTALCSRCGKKHKIRYGYKVEKDGTETLSKSLGFIKCGKGTFLCSVNGKLI